MSHYVSFNTMGDAELVLGSGEDAWHSFGTIFPQGVPLHKAMEIAFPWTGEKEQLVRLSTGQKSEAWGIYRSDSGVEIGTCSASYELIQPAEMFDFLSGFFEENLFYIESAGALKGGKVLFCQAKIGTIDVLGSGDKHQTYLTFNNSFDGSIAAQVYMTLVREVCWNTVNMGLRSKDSATVKFRHTKNVHTKLSQEQSRLIMEGAQATDTNIRQALDKLATLKPTRKTYEAYLDSLFPQDTAQAKNAKAEVTALFADNDNNFVPEFAGTAYAALNAVTRYVDHHAHVRITKNSATKDIQSQRFESSLLGAGATLKDKALERILVLTDGTETCESTPYTSMPTSTTPRYLPPVDETYHSATDSTTGYADGFDRDAAYDMASDTSDALAVLYTTADTSCDLSGTSTACVVETLPSGVQVRRVMVLESNLEAQKAFYHFNECLAVLETEWTALHTR